MEKNAEMKLLPFSSFLWKKRHLKMQSKMMRSSKESTSRDGLTFSIQHPNHVGDIPHRHFRIEF